MKKVIHQSVSSTKEEAKDVTRGIYKRGRQLCAQTYIRKIHQQATVLSIGQPDRRAQAVQLRDMAENTALKRLHGTQNPFQRAAERMKGIFMMAA